MIELEKKLLLSEEEYHYLTEHFDNNTSLIDQPMIRQTNYYFDTDDLSMHRQNITCRIRLKNGTYKGTIKKHSRNSEHSTETAIEVRNGIQDHEFLDMGLILQGELTTYRRTVLKERHCEAVLDKNDYLGHTDYELEIEYAPNHEADAQAVYRYFLEMLPQRNAFSRYAKGNLQSPSKSRRFFERLIMTRKGEAP